MKNKKAVSIMIGYVLLIIFAVAMSLIIYQWIKTYVPNESVSCPDETSLFIKDYSYDCSTDILELTIVNNGKFDVGGYYIYATNASAQSLAIIDLSDFLIGGFTKIGSIIRFHDSNDFEPGTQTTTPHSYDLSGAGFTRIYSIELTPVRWQEVKKKEKPITCGNAKIKELISCDS